MNDSEVGIAAIGVAVAGAGVGYLLASRFKPKVTVSPNPVTAGAVETFTFSGFPPYTGLVSMGYGTNGIVGSGAVPIGSTDQNGNLRIVGTAPSGIPSGTVILYIVFVAANPAIYAATTYTQA